MSKTGIMVCGHGSRDREAIAEFEKLSRALAGRLSGLPVEFGFLEFARPIIRDGLDKLREAGVTDILALPALLFAAGHAKDDMPAVLNTYQQQHSGIRIQYGRDLGIDARLLAAARARIEEAEILADKKIKRSDTLLLVIGRGTSDPDANSNIAKVARMLGEGMGFGWTEVGYSGVTFPLVGPALEHAAKLGYPRIIVFPYFLFTGILVKRIYGVTDEMARLRPDIEFVKAPYLNDHPGVIACALDRIAEITSGANVMNCQLCKYREQIIGFESERGQPQFSHHHHVEGIVQDHHDHGHAHPHDHHHDHDHHHHHPGSHPHGHTHRPYPMADHPLGPKHRDPQKVR
ncbi:MAG TPA: sirohydrochlorin chelatase [Dongiaceae bacterium]|jgi:sirohydrochlorin cobaltochelatase|nr:sirohydrochlorin chelatase [Dongiaceae bacterium]